MCSDCRSFLADHRDLMERLSMPLPPEHMSEQPGSLKFVELNEAMR